MLSVWDYMEAASRGLSWGYNPFAMAGTITMTTRTRCHALTPASTYKDQASRCARDATGKGLCAIHSQMKISGKVVTIWTQEKINVHKSMS